MTYALAVLLAAVVIFGLLNLVRSLWTFVSTGMWRTGDGLPVWIGLGAGVLLVALVWFAFPKTVEPDIAGYSFVEQVDLTPADSMVEVASVNQPGERRLSCRYQNDAPRCDVQLTFRSSVPRAVYSPDCIDVSKRTGRSALALCGLSLNRVDLLFELGAETTRIDWPKHKLIDMPAALRIAGLNENLPLSLPTGDAIRLLDKAVTLLPTTLRDGKIVERIDPKRFGLLNAKAPILIRRLKHARQVEPVALKAEVPGWIADTLRAHFLDGEKLVPQSANMLKAGYFTDLSNLASDACSEENLPSYAAPLPSGPIRNERIAQLRDTHLGVDLLFPKRGSKTRILCDRYAVQMQAASDWLTNKFEAN